MRLEYERLASGLLILRYDARARPARTILAPCDRLLSCHMLVLRYAVRKFALLSSR